MENACIKFKRYITIKMGEKKLFVPQDNSEGCKIWIIRL